MTLAKPNPDEHIPYYSTYTNLVQGDVFSFMTVTHQALHAFVHGLSEAQAEARPAPGEWSVKEVIGHLSDGERLFSYRALRFARSDSTPLASFDPDPYVLAGRFNGRALADLWAEYDAVRAATLALFHSFFDDVFLKRGVASDNPISVRALVYVTAGHEAHHLDSIRDVYLPFLQSAQ